MYPYFGVIQGLQIQSKVLKSGFIFTVFYSTLILLIRLQVLKASK
jgi:hypothetical protein